MKNIGNFIHSTQSIFVACRLHRVNINSTFIHMVSYQLVSPPTTINDDFAIFRLRIYIKLKIVYTF